MARPRRTRTTTEEATQTTAEEVSTSVQPEATKNALREIPESKPLLTKEESQELKDLVDFMKTVYRQTSRVDVRRKLKGWFDLVNNVSERT